MNITVCYKMVPEEQDISVKSDRSLDTSKAEYKISQFDLNAIETALTIKNILPNSVINALSVGGMELENSKGRKDVLSRGPDALFLVQDAELSNMLPDKTALVLSKATAKVPFDLIICGDASGDLYSQQVSMRLGALLDLPVVSGVSAILSATEDSLTVERSLEDEVEQLEIKLPALISVSTDINVPGIPGMKAILAAAKKPVTCYSAADVDALSLSTFAESVGVNAPKEKERKHVMVSGDSEEQIAEFIDHLHKILN